MANTNSEQAPDFEPAEPVEPHTVPAPDQIDDDYFLTAEAFVAHWHIFLPSIIIILAYGTAYGLMVMLGAGNSAIGRLVFVVLAVGGPLLLAHAVLRYFTIRIDVGQDYIRYHTGWPRRLPVDLPVTMIKGARLKRGFGGRLLGGATVVIELITGDAITMVDLNRPEAALDAILRARTA